METIDSRITEFKKALKGMVAASKSSYTKSDSKSSRRAECSYYTSEKINRIVQKGDPVERAKLSRYFFEINGLYRMFILHYATLLTYSWLVVPHPINPRDKIKDKKLSDAYMRAAKFCADFSIEEKFTHISLNVLLDGAYFGIIHYNQDGVVIQDLPYEYCRSRFKNHQDINIVEFNVKFFDTIRDIEYRKEILNTYPKVVQKGYYDYVHKGKNSWIFLPAEVGVYFSFLEDIPFFLGLIPLLDDFEDYKEIDKQRNLLALKKILVQKIGIDGMNLVFEPEEAEEMHEAAISMLSENKDLDTLTTYNDVKILDLSSEDDNKTELTTMQNLIYENAGISKELFCATTDSGLDASLKNDLAIMMILGRKYSKFFTYVINTKLSTKKVNFSFTILPISHYNAEDYSTRSKDLGAFGYSFLTPVLPMGINQTNLLDLKNLEIDLLKLDKALVPYQSAYTQSGKVNAATAETTKQKEQETDTKTTTKEEENEGTSAGTEE